MVRLRSGLKCSMEGWQANSLISWSLKMLPSRCLNCLTSEIVIQKIWSISQLNKSSPSSNSWIAAIRFKWRYLLYPSPFGSPPSPWTANAFWPSSSTLVPPACTNSENVDWSEEHGSMIYLICLHPCDSLKMSLKGRNWRRLISIMSLLVHIRCTRVLLFLFDKILVLVSNFMGMFWSLGCIGPDNVCKLLMK